jgi:hypothetical protein
MGGYIEMLAARQTIAKAAQSDVTLLPPFCLEHFILIPANFALELLMVRCLALFGSNLTSMQPI